VVINAATCSPIARRGAVRPIDFFRSPSNVDVNGTRQLLELCEKCAVQHFLHVSIVGLEAAALPYSRVKLAAERLVRESSVPWSIVRAMPFYYLLEKMLNGMRWLPLWPVPRAIFNPVDTSDVAAYLAQAAYDGHRGVRDEIGGPEDLRFADFVRQYQQARGIRRRLLPVRIAEKTARGMGFVVTSGRRGTLSWSTWLENQQRV
jgi:uncharacterized protein YbjT (DUF2867 family)